MTILNFDKPPKVRSTEEHVNRYVSDGGVPGTYVPNMSKADQERWKAKHIKGADERIEIRKTFNGVQLLIVVYKEIRDTPSRDWRERSKDHNQVRISMNGKLDLTLYNYDQMNAAIMEARELLDIRERDIHVGDTVYVPYSEEGVVKEIAKNTLDYFPYKVEITKGGVFNKVGDEQEYKRSQIRLK